MKGRKALLFNVRSITFTAAIKGYKELLSNFDSV